LVLPPESIRFPDGDYGRRESAHTTMDRRLTAASELTWAKRIWRNERSRWLTREPFRLPGVTTRCPTLSVGCLKCRSGGVRLKYEGRKAGSERLPVARACSLPEWFSGAYKSEERAD
jgi:hypothetical protein